MNLLNSLQRVYHDLIFYIKMYRYKKFVRGFFNYTLFKYDISPSGSKFYEKGRSFENKKDAEEYRVNYIDCVFDNIHKEFDGEVKKLQDNLEAHSIRLTDDIELIESRLDETNPTGFLYNIRENIKYHDEEETKMFHLLFPEKELHTLIKKAREDCESIVGHIRQGDGGSEIAQLNDAMSIKLIFKSLELNVSSFKKSIVHRASFLHSSLYPPKVRYILTFYSFCFILLIAEFAFSWGIIHTITSPIEIDELPILDYFLPVCYCVGMALSFAIVIKLLLERLLHVNKLRTGLLVLVFIGIFAFLAFFFSTQKNTSEAFIFWRFTGKGIIIGFFSVLFAIANALAFREASGLHHIMFKINKKGKPKSLEKEKKKFLDRQQTQLLKRQAELRRHKEKIAHFSENEVAATSRMIENLKSISLSSFWIGYDERVNAIIDQNQELKSLFKLNFANKTTK